MAERPDRWVLIEVTHNEQKIKKVLASWYGGYTGSDSWRLSSGVVSTVDNGDHYAFHNESGSIYECHKTSYGMSGYTSSIYTRWKTKLAETAPGSIRIIGEEEIEASK